jgi:2-polyprenyl-3-methyl-5-hydroxy-6-metoxy-1,4-benzoquinol methylase
MTRVHEGPVVDTANDIEIIECANCGFKHALIYEDSTDIYTSHYYEAEKPSYISSNESESDWWDLTYGERISQIDSMANIEVKNWLDIGTGPGLFLDALKKRNRTATGIEPSVQAHGHAILKGHKVINKYFDSTITSEIGEFDAVHFSEVLEHIPNPLEFLVNVKKVVKLGGFFCVVVPNDYNPIQEIFTEISGIRKWWLEPPFHLNYFNKQSLEHLIERAGFQVVHSTVMFPIDFFLLMGDVYIDNDVVGKLAHERRKRFENSFKSANALDVMRNLYESLASIGLGRELVIFAKRTE